MHTDGLRVGKGSCLHRRYPQSFLHTTALQSVQGVLDIKQARISQYPYESYLSEMGERLAYVHLSDLDENGKLCLPGKGKFDYQTLLKRLKDVGFDGALIIEAYSGDYQEEIELKHACDFLNEKIYSLNF